MRCTLMGMNVLLLLGILIIAQLLASQTTCAEEEQNAVLIESQLVLPESSGGTDANAIQSQPEQQLERIKRGGFQKFHQAALATVLALVGIAGVWGLDFAVTTVFTPLVIITLTKNIELGAIIETCNYRRTVHLTNQDADKQSWLKALLCQPTDGDSRINKRRFFLDVLKVAFKHIDARTMDLLRAEYDVYRRQTEHMSNKSYWNVPKASQSLLVFFEIYGLLDHNHLPPGVTEMELTDALEPAMEQAVQEVSAVDPTLVEEDLKRVQAHLQAEHPERAAEALADAKQFVQNANRVDVIMDKAQAYVEGQYAKTSAKKKIAESVKKVIDFMAKMGGNQKSAEQQAAEKAVEVKRQLTARAELATKADSELSIWEQIEKYGLFNYEIVTKEFLVKIMRQLASSQPELVRSKPANEDGTTRANARRIMLLRIAEEETVNTNAVAGNAQADDKSAEDIKGVEKEIRELRANVEQQQVNEPGQMLYLEPTLMDEYPQLFQYIIRHVFDEEVKNIKNAKNGNNVAAVNADQRKLYAELSALPLHIQRYYIQVELLGMISTLFEELFTRKDHRVQTFYLTWWMRTANVKELFDEWDKKSWRQLNREFRRQLLLHFIGQQQQHFLASVHIADAIHGIWLSAGKNANQRAKETQDKLEEGCVKTHVHNKVKFNECLQNGQALLNSLNQLEHITGILQTVRMQSVVDERLGQILSEMIRAQQSAFKDAIAQNVHYQQRHQTIAAVSPPAAHPKADVHRRRKRFVLSVVLINILRTSAWMQLFKLFNIVEIVRDCIVRTVNYQEFRCDVPPAIKAEQAFIHRLKRILMEELSGNSQIV